MVQTGFVILSIIMAIATIMMIRQVNSDLESEVKKSSQAYMIWLFVWVVYITGIDRSGVIADTSLPPKMPLFIVFPAFAFIFYYLFRTPMKLVTLRIPSHVPIYMQSFRIAVEILIYGAFLENVLPEVVTFDGYNQDIFVGISALGMGWLVHRRKLSRNAILSWNIISLMILSVTVGTFIYSFFFSGITPSPDRMRFVSMPYLLLPAFLMPTAVFLHIISIRQALNHSTE